MVDIIISNLKWFWFAALVLFVIIEAVTQNLTTLWAAVAAVPVMFLSETRLPLRWQVLIFLVITVVLIVFTRPLVIRKFHPGKYRTNVDSLVGQEIIITKKIEMFSKGEGKTKNGIIWNVTSADGLVIEEGTVCIIGNVAGNTLEVSIK